MLKIPPLFFLIILIMTHANRATACSCARDNKICPDLEEFDVVFIGKNITEPDAWERLLAGDESAFDELATVLDSEAKRYTFKVSQAVKGVTKNESIDITTTGDNCSEYFESGKEYIVFGYRGSIDDERKSATKDSPIITNSCLPNSNATDKKMLFCINSTPLEQQQACSLTVLMMQGNSPRIDSSEAILTQVEIASLEGIAKKGDYVHPFAFNLSKMYPPALILDMPCEDGSSNSIPELVLTKIPEQIKVSVTEESEQRFLNPKTRYQFKLPKGIATTVVLTWSYKNRISGSFTNAPDPAALILIPKDTPRIHLDQLYCPMPLPNWSGGKIEIQPAWNESYLKALNYKFAIAMLDQTKKFKFSSLTPTNYYLGILTPLTRECNSISYFLKSDGSRDPEVFTITKDTELDNLDLNFKKLSLEKPNNQPKYEVTIDDTKKSIRIETVPSKVLDSEELELLADFFKIDKN